MRMPPPGSNVTDSWASKAGFGLTDATSKVGAACPSRSASAAASLSNGASGFPGVISNDDVGAGAADRRQAFEHRALLVEPAVARGGLQHRVLAADVIRGRGIAELRF